ASSGSVVAKSERTMSKCPDARRVGSTRSPSSEEIYRGWLVRWNPGAAVRRVRERGETGERSVPSGTNLRRPPPIEHGASEGRGIVAAGLAVRLGAAVGAVARVEVEVEGVAGQDVVPVALGLARSA